MELFIVSSKGYSLDKLLNKLSKASLQKRRRTNTDRGGAAGRGLPDGGARLKRPVSRRVLH